MARKKKTQKDEYLQWLKKIAYGDIQDAIKLLFADDETILQELPRLDLYNISEIKRPKGGGMEIKFFDRIKALEKLSDFNKQENSDASGFYMALEKGAENVWDVIPEKKNV